MNGNFSTETVHENVSSRVRCMSPGRGIDKEAILMCTEVPGNVDGAIIDLISDSAGRNMCYMCDGSNLRNLKVGLGRKGP